MREIIEALQNLKGKEVDIHTKHKLFGSQHIRVVFEPEIETGFGFRFKEQTIYIDKNEIVDYCIEKHKITFEDKLMCIHITEINN